MRQLRRAPAFTLVAALTLGLGIGATAVIFSAIDAVLLRDAPVATQRSRSTLKVERSVSKRRSTFIDSVGAHAICNFCSVPQLVITQPRLARGTSASGRNAFLPMTLTRSGARRAATAWATSMAIKRHSVGVGPVGGVKLIVGEVPGASDEQLRAAADAIKAKAGSFAAMLASSVDEKVMFVAAVSDDVIKRGLKAGDWVRETAALAGGSGGGRPNLAQAGGKHPEKVAEALAKAREFAKARLG